MSAELTSQRALTTAGTAVWTQSSAETQPDQHIAFSRSEDEGKTWSEPRIIAGPKKPGDGHMASWGYPLVSKSGRIYVLYSQHVGRHDTFRHHTGWLHGIHSDDHGRTWSTPQDVKVVISDVRGRVVRRDDLGVLDAGQQSMVWNGEDDHGTVVSSGVYFYLVIAGGESRAGKMVLVR